VRRRLNRLVSVCILFVVAAIMLVCDLTSKLAVRNTLDLGEGMEFIPGIVEIRLAFNDGAAFGIFGGGGIVLIVIAVVVTLVIIGHTVLSARQAWLEVIAKALVLAGGLGNAIDRVGDGLVTDFFNLQFMDFAIFNVADSCLTCGVNIWLIWMLVDALRGSGKNKADPREVRS
jgi:signal peptidase II